MSGPAWRQSWLHPEVLYLSEGAAFRPSDPSLLEGGRRLRAVLPNGAERPLGWVRARSTVLRRVACLRLCATLAPAPGGVRIGPVTRGDFDCLCWVSLHHRRYRSTHSDNPPRSLAPRERAAIFAGDDLLLALGLWRDGLLTGFASLRQSESGGVAELS